MNYDPILLAVSILVFIMGIISICWFIWQWVKPRKKYRVGVDVSVVIPDAYVITNNTGHTITVDGQELDYLDSITMPSLKSSNHIDIEDRQQGEVN